MMSEETGTRAYRLEEEVWIEAPRERVWAALTGEAEVPKWWGVAGQYETTAAEIDLRVGGRYRFTGTSAGMGSFEVGGEYRAVEPPRRLVYTWNPGWEDGAVGSVVEMLLEARDGGTLLRLVHTGFATRSALEDHERGWPPVLRSLKVRTEGGIAADA